MAKKKRWSDDFRQLAKKQRLVDEDERIYEAETDTLMLYCSRICTDYGRQRVKYWQADLTPFDARTKERWIITMLGKTKAEAVDLVGQVYSKNVELLAKAATFPDKPELEEPTE